MSGTSTDLTPEKKRELLAKLLREKAAKEIQTSSLSHSQRALWFVYQLDKKSAAYNVMYAAHIRSDVNEPLLTSAFKVLLQRHEVLRTTYGTKEGLPTQFVHQRQRFDLNLVDATSWSQEKLDEAIQSEADQSFDLEKGPVIRVSLFRRSGNQHALQFTAHHIAMDFWSFDLLFDELEAVYGQLVEGETPDSKPAKYRYIDYVKWQSKMLDSSAGEELVSYWENELSGNLPNLDLPTDRPRPSVQSFNGSSYHFELSENLAIGLESLSKSEGATMYATLLAGFQLLLYRLSNQTDILVGSPTAGRNRAEFEELIGYFLNPVVLRARMAPEKTFRQLLSEVRQTVIGGISQQDCPFPTVVERLQPPRDASRSPIFQVAFGWDKPRRSIEEMAGASGVDRLPSDPAQLGLEPFGLGQQGSAFDLMLMMLSRGDSLSGALQFNSDLFDESTVGRWVEHFQTLLSGIVANPDQSLADLPLLAETQITEMVEQRNQTQCDYRSDQTIHQLIESQVAATPDRVAVQCGAQQLTYLELNSRANSLARHLNDLGVGPDSLVGVYVERSIEMLVGVLGVLKAGGAYVPLSPGTPADRLAYMLEESQAPVVLTTSDLRDELPSNSATSICLDTDWEAISNSSEENVDSPTSSRNLAYVIFTSGSTGKPKGVQLEHQSVVNFLESMQREPGIGPDDTLLAVTTLTFDISVLEIFLPLIVGAKVNIVTREVAADGSQLAKAVGELGTTIMQATPATWRLLIEAGWQGNGEIKVLCGGEAMPRDLGNELLDRCGSLWNMYGPTETTIWSAVDRVEAGDGSVSIGKPIANTQIYILDQQMKPMPIGVPGDLYIGGSGLARGYLNRPELTQERFVSDPFSQDPSARIYKTGDLAKWSPDGGLEFLGRTDFQVKIRGYRIELGEIEAILGRHPDVAQAVVMARQIGQQIDDKQLVGYYVVQDDAAPNVAQLREFLGEQLPDYMLPASFMKLDEFPLNAAGKIDRNALPEPDTARPDLGNTYVAARNRNEEILVEVWESVLGLDEIGVNDNFFELGGASIQSLEISSLVQDEGLDMTPAMMFQHPTVAALAEAVQLIDQSSNPAEANVEVVEDPEVVAERERREREYVKPEPLIDSANTVIESIGIYLPPNEVSTKEVVKGCKKNLWFPLERMTGIKSRRMAGESEFSVELGKNAITECLAHSKYDRDDVEMVVCCNITRIVRKGVVSIEPNTSMQLRHDLGLKNAVVFDITNACTGMFTAISIIDSFIAAGVIRRGMVVSGEYITDITLTAQKEISEFLDPRLACLTVGDAGAALLLEAASTNEVGFHELEMYSLGKYSRMCVGRLTEEPHGGAIMHVPDPMEHTSVAVKHSVANAKFVFEHSPWKPEEMDHLIMHQTSDRSLRDGKRAINKAYKKKICTDENTINNLEKRGNTATTSHFVAVWDNILNSHINTGDNVVFGITGSGQTIGTGIYTFDGLPERVRQSKLDGLGPEKVRASQVEPPLPKNNLARIRIVNLAVLDPNHQVEPETSALNRAAAEACLAQSEYVCREIELLIYTGENRTGYLSEPAIATMIAGDLEMNDTIESETDLKTFAFDIYNGAIATLNACDVASRMMQSGKFKTAMIVASEIETNREVFPDEKLGVFETASAFILEMSDSQVGFGEFVFRYFSEFFEARTVEGFYRDGKPLLNLDEDPEIGDMYLKCIPEAVEELLEREGLRKEDINLVLPPQFSSEFNRNLMTEIGVDEEALVDVPNEKGDLFTSALAYSIDQVNRAGRAKSGDIGLIINVAQGIQVGCAIYYF